MKDGTAIVYTGAHEEIRLRLGDREILAAKEGAPITVPNAIANELLARGDWRKEDDAKPAPAAKPAVKTT